MAERVQGILIRFFLFIFIVSIVPSPSYGSDNIFGFQDDKEQNMKYFPLMAEIGVKWVRTYIFWSDIEPNREDPPKYHWKKYDDHFKQLLDMGFSPIVVIAGNPSWVSTYPGGPFDKGEVKDYTRFVEALVERFDGDGKNDAPGSPKIVYWEIYNEPDLTSPEYAKYPVWGFWGNEPAKYADLLKTVYPAIKKASPDAQVLFGGIALDNWTYFNSKFFEDVLKAGGGPYFDVMNFHCYYPFEEVWEKYGPGIIGKANYVKSQLASYGLRKEMFCTEAGHWSGLNSSLEFQASYLVKLFTRGMAADLKSIIWFVLADWDTKGHDSTRGFLDTRVKKKPSYYVLKHLIPYVKGSIYRQPLSLTDGGDITIQLDWTERLKYKWSPHSIVEGYHFYKPETRKEITVLWSNSKEITGYFFGKSIRVYDRLGKEKDLKRTGSNPISIKVGPDPIFVERLK